MLLHTVYLALGTNLGDRQKNILDAKEQIESQIGAIQRCSSLYETEAWGFISSNLFLNAVLCCYTKLSPFNLLKATQDIECRLGRIKKSSKGEYFDRIIDIDILLYDDIVVNEPYLKIPHPGMLKRDFVMRPLREILPNDHHL